MLYRYRLSTDDLPTVTPSSYRPTSPSREVGSSVGREPFFPSRPEYPDVVPVIISPNRKLRRVPLVSGRSLGDRENDGHGGTTRPQLKKRSPFSLGSGSARRVSEKWIIRSTVSGAPQMLEAWSSRGKTNRGGVRRQLRRWPEIWWLSVGFDPCRASEPCSPKPS